VVLSDCCLRINDFIRGSMKLGLNSLVVLGAWTLGCCTNTAMISFFNGDSPNVQQILKFILEEGELWCLARVGGLASWVQSSLEAARWLAGGHVFLCTWCKCDLLRLGVFECVCLCVLGFVLLAYFFSLMQYKSVVVRAVSIE
jgi:hypothetical protein